MKVIIDTNVLISAILRDRDPKIVIQFVVDDPEFEWVVSQDILTEYRGVLSRPKFHLPLTVWGQWFDLLDTFLTVVEVDLAIDFPTDPGDAKFLACAIVADADFLIPTEQFPQIETERLCLHQLSLLDARDVFEIFSNEEVIQYYDVAMFTTIERAERFINRMNEKFATHEGIRWAIALKSTNHVIGTCGYNVVYSSSRRAMIGYELKRKHWRKGYMQEALHAMIEYGCAELQLHRLEAFVIPGNKRSLRVLSRLGFVEEGILREYGFWKDQFWDMQCFFLLKREWQI